METKKKEEKTEELSAAPPVINPEPTPTVISPQPVATAPVQPVISQPVMSVPPPAQPPAPPQTPVMTAVPPAPKTSKLLWLLLIVFAFVLAALVYVMLNGSFLNKPSNQPTSLTPITVVSPTVVPSPTLTVEQQVQGIDVGSPEGDIQNLKTDLEGLK